MLMNKDITPDVINKSKLNYHNIRGYKMKSFQEFLTEKQTGRPSTETIDTLDADVGDVIEVYIGKNNWSKGEVVGFKNGKWEVKVQALVGTNILRMSPDTEARWPK